ncbi:MAG: aminoglycoside phosphotransferase family protein [Betaproteobacteria bacterium]|nr:aminoglycoside phosphotransferase family protein [Betaproteobacteria bacterium]
MLELLRAAGLAGAKEHPRAVPLAGGVSSDIWKVDLAQGPVCVKRALPRLRVAQLWEAPVERNRYERMWMETVGAIIPGATPGVLAHDDTGFFAMEYLAPERYPLWKTELAAGRADKIHASEVGDRLARIHAATAGNSAIAGRFATDAGFHAIRLEPYLVATARRHPALATRLLALAERTAATRLCLVHGDVSPKNLLIGPQGPVFLDAECAWYGDPAFDAAFCLNHLLLKCLWVPAARDAFLACFDAFSASYLAGADWEPRAALEARVASLLPGLLLARVDGKSPVEYLTGESDKARVRRVGSRLIEAQPSTLAQVRDAWLRS